MSGNLQGKKDMIPYLEFCSEMMIIFFIYNSKNSFKRANDIFQLAKIYRKLDVVFVLIGNKYLMKKKIV